MIPKSKDEQNYSYSEEALVQKYLPLEDIGTLHDALQDIKILKKLVNMLNVTDEFIKTESRSLSMIDGDKNMKKVLENNKESLQFLKNLISTKIIYKMAKERITRTVLINAFKKNSEDGIKILLNMSINNEVRITSSPKIINVILEKISDICNKEK